MNKLQCPLCGKADTTDMSEVGPGVFYCGNCSVDIKKCNRCGSGTLIRRVGASNLTYNCNSCGQSVDRYSSVIKGGY